MATKLEPVDTIDGRPIYNVNGMTNITIVDGDVYGVFIPPEHKGNRADFTIRHDEENVPHLDDPWVDYTFKDWFSVLSLGIKRRTIRVARAESNNPDKNDCIYTSINMDGKARLSQTKAIEYAHHIIYNATTWEKIEYTDGIDVKLSPETMAVFSLLQAEDYTITVQTLTDKGVSRYTANKVLARMIERKILQRCGKRGKQIVYTGVVSRDQLRGMLSE